MINIKKVSDSQRYKINGINNIINIINHDNSIRQVEQCHIIEGLIISIKGDNNKINIPLSTSFTNTRIEIGNSNVTINIGNNNNIHNSNIRCSFGNKQFFKTGFNCTMFGVKFYLDEESSIIIGDNNLFSDNIRIWCCDGHSIIDLNSDKIINMSSEPVIIGSHCWVGQSVIITKKARIANNTIVGAGSVVSKVYQLENTIIAGNPAVVVKKNVKWDGTNPYFLKMRREKSKK